MPRIRERRLARLAARVTQGDTDAEWRRASLEARVAIGAVLRQSLTELGVDPARLAMLRVCDEAAAELAAASAPHPPASSPRAPPSPRPRGARGLPPTRCLSPSRRGEGWGEGPAQTFDTRLGELVRRYRANPTIDFGRASLAQALAWCAASFFAADLLQKQRQDGPQ